MLRISETATRAKLIDPLLTAAGWNLKDRTQVDFEIPVDGYDKEPWNGITDYCLFDPSGTQKMRKRFCVTVAAIARLINRFHSRFVAATAARLAGKPLMKVRREWSGIMFILFIGPCTTELSTATASRG